MKKSKSWIKSLLIIVLAMIMVISLVACNKDNDDDNNNNNNNENNNTELTAAGEYFDTLWKVAAPIGQQKIAATDDIALAFGAEISLDTKKGGMDSVHKVDLGIDVQAVIGRTKSTTNNTSIKLRLYDPTDTENDEIFTLYAFANDLDNLYIDFGGKNIKIPHGMVSHIWQVLRESPKTNMDAVWKEIINGNEVFNTSTIADLLAAKFIGKTPVAKGTPQADTETTPTEKKSINDIINIIVGDFNENWTPSNLISGIFEALEIDIVKILQGLPSSVWSGLSFLGITSADDLLTDGKFDAYQILTGSVMDIVFGEGDSAPTAVTKGNVTTHTATLHSFVQSIVLSFVPQLSEMIDDGAIQLIYNESEGKIQDFTIKLVLAGLESRIPNSAGGTSIITPELSVKINKLRISKADTTNVVDTKVARNLYSDKIAINERFEIAVDGPENGIVVKPIEGLMDEAPLKGSIVLDVKGTVDLVNPAESNESAVNVSVKRYWAGNEEGTDVITGSYYRGKVAVKFAEAIEINGEMVQGYYYDLDTQNAKFDLVAFLNDQVAEFIYTNIKGVDRPVEGNNPGEGGNQGNNPGEGGTGTAQAGAADILTKVLDTINKAFGTAIQMVNTDNNKLTVSTSNILKTIIDFKKAINPAGKGETEWTEENRQIAIVKTMLNVEAGYDTVENCLNKAKTAFENFMSAWSNASTAEDKKTATDTLVGEVKKVAVGLVYIVGSKVCFDGVKYDNLVAADYSKYEIANITEQQMQYINNILAVLAAGITVSGDLQNGINASIVGKIADVTITISNKVSVIDVTNGMFIDVYEQNKAAIEKDPTTINPSDPIWKSLNKTVPEEPGTGSNPGTPDQGQQGA